MGSEWSCGGGVVTRTIFIVCDPSTDAEMRTDLLDCAGERIRALAAPIINEALAHLLQPPSLELKGSAIQGGDRAGNLLGRPREQRPVKTYCDLSPIDRPVVRQRVLDAARLNPVLWEAPERSARGGWVPGPRLAWSPIKVRGVGEEERHAAGGDRVEEAVLVRQIALDDRAEQRGGHEPMCCGGRQAHRAVITDREVVHVGPACVEQA
mmetsp:Transcript_53458/g.120000  ORF Transcript_53458/g.120000 Transcript_53458/m.120000 type:complete len:209 (-) Transcript_53458:287-913(-)